MATTSQFAAPRVGEIGVCVAYPFRWTPQQPSNVAAETHFAAPGSGDSFTVRTPPGRARSNLVRVAYPLELQTALESGPQGSFAQFAAPQGWRGLSLCSLPAPLDTSVALESGDSCTVRSLPPGMARSNLSLRSPPTPLAAPKKPAKVASVSQFAPPGMARAAFERGDGLTVGIPPLGCEV